MPSSTFILKYAVANELVIGVSALVSDYLHGIPLTDLQGNSYSIQSLKRKIATATIQMENFLFLKIIEQERTDQMDYIEEEWRNWASIKLPFAPNRIKSIIGYLSDVQTFVLQPENFVIKGKNIAWVPGSNFGTSGPIIGAGGNIVLIRAGIRIVPNFWHVKYDTGFTDVPLDIIQAIAKLAAMQVLAILGDIVLGAGISGQNLSVDGLSQSIQTTNSAGHSAYGARVTQYATELFGLDQRGQERMGELHWLRDQYRGITFEVV